MSRNVSVIAAAVFAVLLLGVVQLGRAQSTSTAAGDVPAVTELYRMKLVRADTAAREVWSKLKRLFCNGRLGCHRQAF